MRTIIAGPRDFYDEEKVYRAIERSGFEITEVLCGCARGVDTIGKKWGDHHGIPVKEFPPDWDLYGKSAGPIRNTQMVMDADCLIAVWDGVSKGTKNCIQTAIKFKRKVFVYLTQKIVTPQWLLDGALTVDYLE